MIIHEKTSSFRKFLRADFLCVGIAFLFLEAMCIIGFIKMSLQSVIQDSSVMGALFAAIGAIFCIFQTILRIHGNRKTKLYNDLLRDGRKLNGTVEKIYLQKWIQFGHKSPSSYVNIITQKISNHVDPRFGQV